jgi:hypothetical protein
MIQVGLDAQPTMDRQRRADYQAVARELVVAGVPEHLGRSEGGEGVTLDHHWAFDLSTFAKARREAGGQPAQFLAGAEIDLNLWATASSHPISETMAASRLTSRSSHSQSFTKTCGFLVE